MKIKSLKLKIILLSTSVILFFGMLAILFVFFEGFSVLKKQGIQNLSEVTAVQTVALSTTFENARTRIDHLAHNNSVTPYLEHSEAESAADVLRHFELNNRDEVFSVIYLMDTDGLTLVSTDPRFTGNNYEFREYFQTAMTGETDVYTAKGVTSNEVGYYFSAPVYSASNTIIGVIVGKATPEYIHTPLEILADEEEDIMLTDDKGIVLYSKEEERLYASLGELTEEELSNIEDKRQYEGIKIESLGYKPVKEELDKASTTSIIEHDNKTNGREEIISISKISEYPYFLIIEKDADQFLKSAYNLVTRLSIFIFSMVILAIIAIAYYISKLLKPIDDLESAVKSIGQGDLTPHVHIKTGDELEHLSETINKMAAEIESTIAQKNEVNKMKSEFISIASHQLKTPLGAIKLLLESFHDNGITKLNKTQKEHLFDVDRLVKQMIDLINDLLDVSRLDTGALTITPTQTNITHFLEAMIEEAKLSPELNEAKLLFNTSITKDLSLPIDKSLFHQVISNIISNAIRYSSNKNGEILINLDQDSQGLLISIKDEGIGISEDKDKIFSKFFRTDRAKKLFTEGSGLGLYVSEMIMKASGGKIWFESEGYEKGTTFFVQIPNAGMPSVTGEVDITKRMHKQYESIN